MYSIVVKNVSKSFRKPKERTLKRNILAKFKGEKTYSEFTTLQDVSFSVHKGESFGILGKNGAGKSTLFKILSGIIYPNSGEIQVNGKIVPLIELGAGLHGDLSGRENIRLNCSIFGLNNQEIEQIMPQIIEFSELQDFMRTPVKHYSSGMKARLGFSIAVHIDADIILIDEVLSVGDKDFKEKCNVKMESLKKAGKTLLIVSHSTHSLKKICDRGLILDKGQVVAMGEINEVLAKYEGK